VPLGAPFEAKRCGLHAGHQPSLTVAVAGAARVFLIVEGCHELARACRLVLCVRVCCVYIYMYSSLLKAATNLHTPVLWCLYNVCIHTHTHTHTRARAHTHTHNIYIRIHTIYVYIYIYIYIYIQGIPGGAFRRAKRCACTVANTPDTFQDTGRGDQGGYPQ